MRVALGTSGLGILLAAGLYAQPAPEAPAAETETTVVRGRVRMGPSGGPVRGAKIAILASGNSRDAKASVYSGFDGSFEIKDAPVGVSTISIIKSGYQDYRERVSIPSGRALEGLTLRLNRLSVIAGRVTDDAGQPVVGAKVQALREGSVEGRAFIIVRAGSRMAGGMQTDDRGVYRIYGLEAAEYRVVVTPKEEPALTGELVFSKRMVYFPNAERLIDAELLRVGWGEEKQGIDIRIQKAPATLAKGRVTFPDGIGSIEQASLELFRTEGSTQVSLARGRFADDGSFAIAGLPPGAYTVTATSFDRQTSKMAFGSETFDVSEGRTETVRLDGFGERAVVGRVVLVDPPESVVGAEGKEWMAQVQLRPPARDPAGPRLTRGSFGQAKSTNTEAMFELSVVPGTHRLTVHPPDGGYVTGVKMGDRLLDEPDIEISKQQAPEKIVVTVTFGAGTVSGTVRADGAAHQASVLRSSGGLLPRAAAVWLLPADGREGFHRPLMDRATDENTFEVKNVPPGEYRAFAVPERPGYSFDDPEYRRKFASYGEKVTVKAGEPAAVNPRELPVMAGFGQD